MQSNQAPRLCRRLGILTEEMVRLLTGSPPKNHKTLLDCSIIERDSTKRQEETP